MKFATMRIPPSAQRDHNLYALRAQGCALGHPLW